MSNYMGCDGPGMHRLHDTGDNVAPCPCCGRHHFGPRNQIEDSSVVVYYRGTPTLAQLFGRLVCRGRDHVWSCHPERFMYGHVQACLRCDAARMTVPVIVVGEPGDPYSLHGRDPVPQEVKT